MELSLPPRSSPRSELIGILAADSAPRRAGGMQARQKRPGVPRPACVVQSMMPDAGLMRQFRIAELHRPLFDVEAELRIVERQFVQMAEQPGERHPVVSGKIAQNTGCSSPSVNCLTA